MKKQAQQTSPIGIVLTYAMPVGAPFTATIESFSRDGHTRYDRNELGRLEDCSVIDRYDATPTQRSAHSDGRRCVSCYLGHAHSEAYHAAAVAEWEAQHPAAKAEAERHAAWVACYL